MSLWHELTALYCFDESRISCEIHVGRQRSDRCFYKMILRRKHAVHQSTSRLRTKRYSRPRHLAASFPFPAQAKNKKNAVVKSPDSLADPVLTAKSISWRVWVRRGVYRILVRKPERRRPPGRPRRRWVDNIRMDLQEVGCGYMDWIGLAQDRDTWRTLVSAVMNLRVP